MSKLICASYCRRVYVLTRHVKSCRPWSCQPLITGKTNYRVAFNHRTENSFSDPVRVHPSPLCRVQTASCVLMLMHRFYYSLLWRWTISCVSLKYMHTIGRSDVLIVSQRVTKAKSNITVVNLNRRWTIVRALKSHMAFGVETVSKFEMLNNKSWTTSFICITNCCKICPPFWFLINTTRLTMLFWVVNYVKTIQIEKYYFLFYTIGY